MSSFSAQLDNHQALNQLLVPDLWQHEAITHLREGRDVIVNAPTGSGKTLIFEQWANSGRHRGQAVYTVPTRALANDKLAEWRGKGWNVGITTGDLAENLSAPIIVATLEAQKNRLLSREGPDLLVIDEYQMIKDPDRGLNYELAIAQAPRTTQLLLLSGSVSNPQQVAQWLTRIGRNAVTVTHQKRAVPLEEVFPLHLSYHLPRHIKTYWPQLVTKALAEDLGPILIFAPRRAAAEKLAYELARQLPPAQPLDLSDDQKHLVGDSLARALSSRVSYHHSGLSYAARAGVIEPLAKAGQLRVVVATMGLAAGINFSLRSVALAADSYRRNHQEQSLSPDEILQMHGRAGRRGIDETGFVLVSANHLRLRDGFALDLTRNQLIDWSTLLGIMSLAAERNGCPFTAALEVQERLFTTKPIPLGVESALEFPQTPCHLPTDSERARLVRSRVKRFRNSRAEWEDLPDPIPTPLEKVFVQTLSRESQSRAEGSQENFSLVPALGHYRTLHGIVGGGLIEHKTVGQAIVYHQSFKVAEAIESNRILLGKKIRKITKWRGRYVTRKRWEEKLVPLIEKSFQERNTPVVRITNEDQVFSVEISLASYQVAAVHDAHGIAILNPRMRRAAPAPCRKCPLVSTCESLPRATGTALQWRRLDLIDSQGYPTRRGKIVSFFGQGDGLAMAAALENAEYPLEELIFDLANLDGGFRFAGDENRWAGRIAESCRAAYGNINIHGYLENGLPLNYGSGASEIVHALYRNPQGKHHWTSDLLGVGDIDRILIEWRSRLRHISTTPRFEWDRWEEFRKLAKSTLSETESPTATEFPPLSHPQKQRINHRIHPSQFKQRNP